MKFLRNAILGIVILAVLTLLAFEYIATILLTILVFVVGGV